MTPCVKFYRSIIQWRWFRVAEMVQLIMYYVCKADHEPYTIDGILVEKGQVLITRRDVCSELEMSDQTFKTCMKRLVEDKKITTTAAVFKNTLVTVVNFSRYVDCVDAPNIVRSGTDSISKDVQSDVASSQEVPSSLFPDVVSETTPKLSNSQKKKQEVDCDFIVNLYHDRCPSLPKVIKLSDKRKMKIRVRFEEMSFSYETLQEVFDRCEASYFMRGDNNRGWKADFDWIMANSQNWVKVLEGKYDNRTNTPYSSNETKQTDRYAKRRGADSAALTSEDFTDAL